MEENRNGYRAFVGNPKGESPRRRWENNIKLDLKYDRRT
jgi:hypothetical protein